MSSKHPPCLPSLTKLDGWGVRCVNAFASAWRVARSRISSCTSLRPDVTTELSPATPLKNSQPAKRSEIPQKARQKPCIGTTCMAWGKKLSLRKGEQERTLSGHTTDTEPINLQPKPSKSNKIARIRSSRVLKRSKNHEQSGLGFGAVLPLPRLILLLLLHAATANARAVQLPSRPNLPIIYYVANFPCHRMYVTYQALKNIHYI